MPPATPRQRSPGRRGTVPAVDLARVARASGGPMTSARILVGTCSWTDPTLIACGRFYPAGVTSAEARLRYYARAVPHRRGRLDLLRAAVGAQRAALGGAHARRLRLRRQGLRPAHRPRTRVDRLPDWLRGRVSARETRGQGTSTSRTCRPRASSSSGRSTATPWQPLARPASSAPCSSSSRPGSRAPSENGDYLRSLPRRLPGWPLAVEFRGGGWMEDEAAAGTPAPCSRRRGSPT